MDQVTLRIYLVSTLVIRNQGLRSGTGAPCSPLRTPDFLSSFLALAKFMPLSLMKAAHAGVGGASRRKSGYMGRTRCFSNAFTPCISTLAPAVSCPQSKSVRKGCAPSSSAHIRCCECGASVQGSGLRCTLEDGIGPFRVHSSAMSRLQKRRIPKPDPSYRSKAIEQQFQIGKLWPDSRSALGQDVMRGHAPVFGYDKTDGKIRKVQHFPIDIAASSTR
jgi:hypothetical protein